MVAITADMAPFATTLAAVPAASLAALTAAPFRPLADPLEAPVDVTRQVGLVGVAAAVLLALAALAARARVRPLPAAGLAMAAAGLVAIAVSDADEAGGRGHVVGVALAALGAWLGERAGLPRLAQAALVLPGAALAVSAMHIEDRPTVIWPTVVVAAALAAAVADADASLARSAAGPPLLAVSAFGMYATIPETGQILPVLVVVVPIALVGAPLGLARLGTAGSGAIVVLLAAVVAEGGQTRAASIVGGLAGLGVLVLEPVARALVPRVRPWPADWRHRRILGLAGLQAVVVLLTSRVAGLRDDLEGSTAIVVAIGVLTLGALVVLVRDVERAAGDR